MPSFLVAVTPLGGDAIPDQHGMLPAHRPTPAGSLSPQEVGRLLGASRASIGTEIACGACPGGRDGSHRLLGSPRPRGLGAARGLPCRPDRQTRFWRYEVLAERALAPVGGPWPADAVNVRLEGKDWTTEDVGAAVAEAGALWHSLVAG
jgi:hypothetical protein